MPSLLFTVFALQLVLHIINTAGAATINEICWSLYNRFLPTSTSKAAQEQIKLRREVVRLKRELAGVSAQDDFAKWAKLRRQHDKAVTECDKMTASLGSTKSSFDSRLNTLRFLSTNGLKLFLQFWYARQAMFWIPQGWVPYYAEWILSFPRAPLGSVSLQMWSIACASVIGLVGEAVVAGVVLMLGTAVEKGKEKKRAEVKVDVKMGR